MALQYTSNSGAGKYGVQRVSDDELEIQPKFARGAGCLFFGGFLLALAIVIWLIIHAAEIKIMLGN